MEDYDEEDNTKKGRKRKDLEEWMVRPEGTGRNNTTRRNGALAPDFSTTIDH